MLCADDAGIVSKSVDSLAKMMTVIVTVFEAAGLTVSEKSKTMLLRTPDQAPCTSPLVIEAAGQRYTDNAVFVSGRSYRRKRRYYARDQTAGPTRMGMPQSIQAGAVRYGGTTKSRLPFRLYVRGGRGLTAAAVTLDTVADESRKMADGVASRDGKICCDGDALSTIFLFAAFVPCSLLFVFRFSSLTFIFIFPASRYV